jgi:indolepyruvate ferredoxin oxidoreductase
MRRVERALIDEYRHLVADALGHLVPASADTVTAIAALPEEVRGYEDVKRATIGSFRAHADDLVGALARSPATDEATHSPTHRWPIAG